MILPEDQQRSLIVVLQWRSISQGVNPGFHEPLVALWGELELANGSGT